jgi:phosphoserine aminotransferase
MNVPKNYKVFFFQGGASMQFTAIPFNLLRDKKKATYLNTGFWGAGAEKEAKKYCEVINAWSNPPKDQYLFTIPEPSTWVQD